MLRLAARCMFLLLALAALPSAAALARGNPMAREGALSSPVHEIMVEKDVMVPLRDGTLASIDIYRPRASGRFPVLVEGTAYAKSCSTDIRMSTHTFFVPRGYVFIIWNTRGRFKSGGVFRMDIPQGEDGYDIVEWAAAQPWSNGKIALVGKSYSGQILFQTAATRPPHLVCAIDALTHTDAWRWYYRGGAMEYGFAIYWASAILGPDQAQKRLADKPEALRRWQETLSMYLADPEHFAGAIPAIGFTPAAIDATTNLVREWASHPTDGPFWRRLSPSASFDRITIPMLHVGGWFDIFLSGALEAFQGISARGGSPLARENQRLLLGPWHHSVPSYSRSKIGAVDYGPALREPDFNTLRLAFLDYWLKNIRSSYYDPAIPVRYFTMNGAWQVAPSWPPKAQEQAWYFHPGKGAPSFSLNDGGLSRCPPASPTAPPQRFVYDPMNPLPTRGGSGLLLFAFGPDGLTDYGQQDQRPVDHKSLTFTSAPLRRDMTVTGPLGVELYGASSAVDTDWVARLEDVAPEGVSLNVAEGILRTRFRNSAIMPQLLTPGRAYLFHVDMGATSYIFKAGHRLRVTVNSSSFPRWSRNMNVAAFPEQADCWEQAANAVLLDAAHPSRLLLPVVGGGGNIPPDSPGDETAPPR